MQNPYIMAWLEPLKKETPEMTEDEFIELLDEVLIEDYEDLEEEPQPICNTKIADELPDNLCSDPVFPVFPIGGVPPLTPSDAYAMAPEPDPEPEPHLLSINDDSPTIIYNYITIPAEKYGNPEKQTIIKYDNLDNLAECDIIGLKHLRNTADPKIMKCTAQVKILTHKRPNNMVLARIYKRYAKEGGAFRTWTQCTPNMALNLIKQNNSLYEIVDQYPHKIYFDIDEPYIAGGSLNMNDYLPSYVAKIKNIFKNADLAISGDISTIKISFHIVIDNYLVRDEDEKKQLIHIANFIGADNTVYSNNKLIKMLNQAKPPPDHIRTQKPIYGDDPKKHIITAFFNEKTAYSMPNWKRTIENTKNEAPEVVELKLKLYGQTLSKPFDMANAPKKVLNLDILNFDIYTATAEQLLEITPLNDEQKHTYTSKFALFAYHHIKSESMGFNEFIKWRLANKRIKHGETENDFYDRWQKWWQNIPPQKTADGNFKYKSMSVENLRWFMLQNNPELHRDKFLNQFLKMFNDANFNDCDRLIIERLDHTHYDHNNRKYVIANIGMCGGKTAQTAKYLLENSDKQFMWIVNKIALAQNTCERLRAEGLKIYNYKQRREEKKAELNDSNNLLVCLNSLHLAESLKLIDSNKIVIIDEIETFLITWFDNATLNNHRVDKGHLWRLLLEILRKAEKVIFLDAFISSHTIEFIKLLESDQIPLLIRRPSEKTSRKVQFLNKYDKWLGDILDDLAEGKKLFIFYPYYNRQTKPIHLPSMEELQRFLIEETKKRANIDIKGLYYHGQIDQVRTNELYNVGEAWDNINFIICNTKITVGVSYEGANTFDRCYILALGWVEPRDIIQVSYRARTLNDDLIKICLLSTFNMNVNYKCDEHNLESMCNRVENAFCPIYKNVVKNILNERWSPYEQKLLAFIKFAGYTIIEGDIAINPILQENLRRFLEGQEIKHLYHNIRLIKIDDEDRNEIELIKKKLYNNEATEIDQIEYKKWEFDGFFKNHNEIELGGGAEDEETGEYIPDTMSNEKLESYKGIIWDKKYFKAMDYMRYILMITTDRNYKIFNEFKTMFNGAYIPSEEQLNEIMRKKIKLNENLLDLIFVDKFRTITRKSSPIHIIKHIYNTTFGKKLISVSKVRHNVKIDAELETIINILPLILNLPEVKICNVEGESDQTEPKQFINYDEEEDTTTDEDL